MHSTPIICVKRNFEELLKQPRVG